MTADPWAGEDNWRTRAACRAADPDSFFPVAEPGTDAYELQVAEAKKVCAACPVRAACLRWAMDSHFKDGVWGGTTPDERRLERRRRNRRIREYTS